MNRPAVTALVVSYRTGPVLKDCLQVLLAGPEIDAIQVVDNGNPADMAAWLDQLAVSESKLNLLRPGENLGFGRAVNLAASRTVTPHLLVLNPDAVLQTGAVSALQETALHQTPPWIVGGRIEDANGIEQRGGRRRDLTLWRALTGFIGINTWTLEQTPAPERPVPMPVISGAFFLTSKASFAELGGFDEAYFLHVEDVDLCKRCREVGGHVIYDPRAVAVHHGATSDVSGKTVARHKADSLARYFSQHSSGPIERILAAAIMPLAKMLMSIRAR